jgi:hypothetical protein
LTSSTTPAENLLRGDEAFVIAAVAKEFGGTCRPGENPPDAYFSVGSRVIAVEISTLTQHVTDDCGTRERMSDDKPAIDLVNELNAELCAVVPDDQSIGLILSSPISKKRKTKTALARVLRDKLSDANAFTTKTNVKINGNVIMIQRHEGHRAKKIWGGVSNPSSSPDILVNARYILEDRIIEKVKKCSKFVGRNPLWLALLNDYWLADADTYKDALSCFSQAHPFEKILLVNRDGTVASLFDV